MVGFDGTDVEVVAVAGRIAASVGPVTVGIDGADVVVDSVGIDLVGEGVPDSGGSSRSVNVLRLGGSSAPMIFGG